MGNNKGFMMAEVVVVSAIILITLSVLYQSYIKIYQVYSTRIDYYDTVTLYRLGYYRDILIENNKMNDILNEAKTTRVFNIYDSINNEGSIFSLPDSETSNYIEDKVFLIYNNQNNIDSNILNGIDNIHTTFKDYIDFLKTSVNLTNSNYVMVMERCNQDNENDCKYAYLEIYDGYEMNTPR